MATDGSTHTQKNKPEKFTVGMHFQKVYEVSAADFNYDQDKVYAYAVAHAARICEYNVMEVTQIDVFPTPE